MTYPRQLLLNDVLNAFREKNTVVAWELVFYNIANKEGHGIPNDALTSDAVPLDSDWTRNSIAQAFALTYERGASQLDDSNHPYSLRNIWITLPNVEAFKGASLTVLRAALYALKIESSRSRRKPDFEVIRQLLNQIRMRLRLHESEKTKVTNRTNKKNEKGSERHQTTKRRESEKSKSTAIHREISAINKQLNKGGIGTYRRDALLKRRTELQDMVMRGIPTRIFRGGLPSLGKRR